MAGSGKGDPGVRRLAIARGCPEDFASEGVRFYQNDDGTWRMDAGFAYYAFAWSCDIPHTGNDCVTALALAWPADKRVTT